MLLLFIQTIIVIDIVIDFLSFIILHYVIGS